ncbi:choice-of-anchor M domain-containing protein [Arcanobacterium hippocoleae]
MNNELSDLREKGLQSFRKYLGLTLSAMLLLSACAAAADAGEFTAESANRNQNPAVFEKTINVVASTPIIADLVRQIAPAAHLATLVPPGADPHTYEPSLAAIRDVARADIAFSNQLLLEEQSLLKTIDANLPDHAKHVGLGNDAVKYGATHIQLIEDASLSTVWLGFRVDGSGGSNATVEITAVNMEGPGVLAAFTTGTFGQPTAWISSSDGIDPENDRVELPTNAHTHMSWGFSKPGEYRLQVKAALKDGEKRRDLGSSEIHFIVGKIRKPKHSRLSTPATSTLPRT